MIDLENLKKEKNGSIIIPVPANIRFMSQWKEFSIPDIPHIMNKQIPGCGFTEYCITNSEDVILCSPRKILLQNKFEQHKDEVYLVVNERDKDIATDKDLTTISKNYGPSIKSNKKIEQEDEESFFKRLTFEISTYIKDCRYHNKPAKILVTYDSFRIVKDIVKYNDNISKFRVVIDEFQSIFTDSKFKSSTELTFMENLQDLQKVCYVSATPMMKEYLNMLDEFKNLPYYELDWGSLEPGRISRPYLIIRGLVSVFSSAKPIIEKYLAGEFEYRYTKTTDGSFKRVESREVVFYVNSVKNITSIIKRAKLLPEQVNILVANTEENAKRIKRLGRKFSIGRVPLRNEERKMFTFCTRTVYLGADFYSDNAQTIIISDANIDTLAVDITLDLPQIMGRQRLSENPWKNEAILYFKTITQGNQENESVFLEKIKEKDENTKGLLSVFGKGDNKEQSILSDAYQRLARSDNYRKDYVAVNIKNTGERVPVINKLVRISELRAFEIQQKDYANRFTVFSELGKVGCVKDKNDYEEFFTVYDSLKTRRDKLKYLCEYNLVHGHDLDDLLNLITEKRFKEYIKVLGLDQCKAMSYTPSYLDKKLNVLSFDLTSLKNEVYSKFEVGKSYSKAYIKEELNSIYKRADYRAKAKASDIQQFFKAKSGKAKVDGKWENGFKLLSKKL